jgi:pimeloyl-ACP methyl ester carboxylesterase
MNLVEYFKKKYSPEDLPYHIVVPSIPGYGYSSGAPVDKDWTLLDSVRVLHGVLMELGFKNGFISHGCNLGAWISQELGRNYPTCKALHLTFCPLREAEVSSPPEISDLERAGLPRGEEYAVGGDAYLREHGTRPSTIGLALSSSPIALLAWIAEKFLTWTDEDPSLEDILTSVSLYWLTDTYARSLYPYREFVTVTGVGRLLKPYSGLTRRPLDSPERYIRTPVGYSWFPKVLTPTPVSWVKLMTNLVWSRIHDKAS